jgi:uncharacterized coiled-coil DUF342 family protein
MLRKLDIARAWQRAREQFATVVAERDALREELRQVKAERDEFRRCLAELRAAVTARWEAEARLADLYREREIARARAAERDFGQPLN